MKTFILKNGQTFELENNFKKNVYPNVRSKRADYFDMDYEYLITEAESYYFPQDDLSQLSFSPSEALHENSK